MAFNVRSGGKATSVPVPNTVKSGDVVRVGSLTGVAEIDATQKSDGLYYTTLALEGIAHDTLPTAAITVGQAIYTATAGPGKVGLTGATTAGSKLVGIATTAKASGAAGQVWFKLVPNATVTV
jgi:predicted RecA/RadA family phage recombinase